MSLTFELNSQRLSIRPWRAEDRPALGQMTGDPEMMRYITAGRTWSEAQIDALLDRQAKHLARHGICFGAVWLKSAGKIVGLAGMQQHDDGLFELGWWMWKAHWGQGYATEAAQACVDHAREVMQLDCLVAIIDPPNIASRRVAEKIGMRHIDTRSAQQTMAWREDIPIDYFRMELA